MLQLLLVLKLAALVDHLMVLAVVFFQCLTNLLFIMVELHPESSSTLNLWFSLSLSGCLSLIYPIVTVERSSYFVFFLGQSNSAAEAKHLILSQIISLPLIFLVSLPFCSNGAYQSDSESLSSRIISSLSIDFRKAFSSF
jgi:hypothetical protein